MVLIGNRDAVKKYTRTLLYTFESYLPQNASTNGLGHFYSASKAATQETIIIINKAHTQEQSSLSREASLS